MPLDANWWVVALALSGPWLLVGLRRPARTSEGAAARRLATIAGLWTLVGAVVIFVLVVEHRGPGGFGLGQFTSRSAVIGGVIGAAGLALFPLYLGISILLRLPRPPAVEMQGISRLPVWLKLLTLATAAIAEEILYRGFAIPALAGLTGSVLLASTVSLAAFMIAHFRWGLGHLIYVGLAGGLMTVAFLLTGDLWANILGHAIIDLPAILFAGQVAARMERSTAGQEPPPSAANP